MLPTMTDFTFDFSDVPRLPEGYRYRLVDYIAYEYDYFLDVKHIRKVVVERKRTEIHKPWFRKPYQTQHWEGIGSAPLPLGYTFDDVADAAKVVYLKSLGFNGNAT